MQMLVIFVEGEDDERFFEKIINPLFQKKYFDVKLWKYSKKKFEKRKSFIKSIRRMKADCIYVVDINQETSINSKKEKIVQEIGIEKDNIIVVVKEIEGWYLAGLSAKTSKRLGISNIENTDNITKEDFNRLIPQKTGSRIVFMEEILKEYDTETAKEKNKSLKYFLDKYGF